MFKLIVFYLLLELRQVIACCKHGQENHKTEHGIYYVADCSGCRLTKVPSDLKTSIEGLYLTNNFIRSLENTSFSQYTSLKFLYLDDNNFNPSKIESNTFAPLTNLEELDLSQVSGLNFSLLYLPKTLQKLFLYQVNDNFTEIPLNYLEKLSSLSMSDSYNRLPSFGGAFPSLTKLNFQNNPLKYLNIEEFAHLCKLETLNITFIKKLDDPCECNRFEKWTKDHRITVDPSPFCERAKDPKCDLQPSKKAMENYENCMQEARKRGIFHWVYIGGSIAIGVFLCIILYLCCTRRKTCCKIFCCQKDRMISINT